MAAHRMAGPLAGRYELHRLVGTGGMARVVAGYDRVLDRDVAIKLLRPEVARDDRVRRRFLHEAQVAARFHHPNAVTVFDAGEADGQLFMVMELVEGRTAADELVARGPFPPDRTARVALQVLGALEAAHAEDFIHRDVKPSNILLPTSGGAKLTDFGLAGRLRMLETLDGGRLLGTPGYLAPEQVEGQPATRRSDVYAMGVTLYAMLAGEPPFGGADAWARATSHRHANPRPLLDVRPELDDALVDVVERAMALDPRDRFGDARKMADALRARSLAGHHYSGPARELGGPPPLPPEPQPRFWRWAGRLVAVLLGLAGLATAIALLVAR